MNSDTQFQIVCWLCFVPMAAVFVMAVLYGWAHPGPDLTPDEMKQREQAGELMGELLWQEKFDRDDRRRMGRRK